MAAEPFAVDDGDVVSAMAIAQRHLGTGDRAPGTQGVFGVPFDLASLVDHIGLDADTNTNLTRRMLLLLESREVAGAVHEHAWRTVLDRYLNYGIKDFRPPRFLLNDLTRYWRTICVDFEGKHRDTQGNDPKWVSRNAKLRTSRKLLFAGGLIPIILCHLHERAAMRSFLERWLKAPPLDRLEWSLGYRVRLERALRRWATLPTQQRVQSAACPVLGFSRKTGVEYPASVGTRSRLVCGDAGSHAQPPMVQASSPVGIAQMFSLRSRMSRVARMPCPWCSSSILRPPRHFWLTYLDSIGV
jgi:hypothetical protein